MAKRSRALASADRAENNRDKIIENNELLVFNFRHFLEHEHAGQTLAEWCTESAMLLPDFFRKLIHLSDQNLTVSLSEKSITLYDTFPDKSKTDFQCPKGMEQKNWGTLRNIGGQKARVAGFLQGRTFFPVFLDQHHLFYKSSKK